jgi:hypothetical protein
MKLFSVGIYIVILLSFFACKKKESAVAPVVKPPVITPTKGDTTTPHLPSISYPHTDTFVGLLSVNYFYYQFKDSSYRLWVTHLTADSITVRSSYPIPIDYTRLYLTIDKVTQNNPSGIYTTSFTYSWVHHHDPLQTFTDPAGVTIGLSDKIAKLAWNESCEINGGHEIEQNIGNYYGTIKH